MSEMINGLFPGVLQPSKTVAGCIDIFENAWPDPQRTINMIEEQVADPNVDFSWQKASTVGHGSRQNIRTNRHIGISHVAEIDSNPVCQNIHNQFNLLLLATTVPYSYRYKLDEPLFHEGYNLLKYAGGQQYHQHYDGTSKSGRTISAICYLNNDYEGGELEFPNFGVTVKPQAGMLILFPSNYAYGHVAHPIISGTKYALVTWIHDRPVDWERS